MKRIEINNDFFTIKTTFNDLTIREFCELIAIQNRRELKQDNEDDRIVENKVDNQYIEVGMESDLFLLTKNKDYLHVITDIKDDYLMQQELQFILLEEVEFILHNDSENTSSYTMDGNHYKFVLDEDTYYIPTFQELCFQQFADIESYKEHGLWYVLVVLLQQNKLNEYNRFHQNWNDKIILIENTKAASIIDLLFAIMGEISIVKAKYNFLFMGEDISEPSPHLDKHSQLFKWEEVIATLAETPIFNGAKGTLNAIRTELAINVLEYLNLKKSKAIAQYKQDKARQNKH